MLNTALDLLIGSVEVAIMIYGALLFMPIPLPLPSQDFVVAMATFAFGGVLLLISSRE